MKNIVLISLIYVTNLGSLSATLPVDRLVVCNKTFTPGEEITLNEDSIIKANVIDKNYLQIKRYSVQNGGVGNVNDNILTDVIGFRPDLQKLRDLYGIEGIRIEDMREGQYNYRVFEYSIPTIMRFFQIMREQRQLNNEKGEVQLMPAIFDYYIVDEVVNDITYLEKFVDDKLPLAGEGRWLGHDYVVHSFNNQLFDHGFFIPLKSTSKALLLLNKAVKQTKASMSKGEWKNRGGHDIEKYVADRIDEVSTWVDAFTFNSLKPIHHNRLRGEELVSALKKAMYEEVFKVLPRLQNPTDRTSNGHDLLHSLIPYARVKKIDRSLAYDIMYSVELQAQSYLLYNARLTNLAFENMFKKFTERILVQKND